MISEPVCFISRTQNGFTCDWPHLKTCANFFFFFAFVFLLRFGGRGRRFASRRLGAGLVRKSEVSSCGLTPCSFVWLAGTCFCASRRVGRCRGSGSCKLQSMLFGMLARYTGVWMRKAMPADCVSCRSTVAESTLRFYFIFWVCVERLVHNAAAEPWDPPAAHIGLNRLTG